MGPNDRVGSGFGQVEMDEGSAYFPSGFEPSEKTSCGLLLLARLPSFPGCQGSTFADPLLGRLNLHNGRVYVLGM